MRPTKAKETLVGCAETRLYLETILRHANAVVRLALFSESRKLGIKREDINKKSASLCVGVGRTRTPTRV